MATPKLHVLREDGLTFCGLRVDEGLRPNQAQHATCKRCLAALLKGFKP